MIKNHQNFKENNKTATFVENFLQTNSHKQEKPDLEDKMGKSVKIISTLRLRVDGAKKNPVQLRFQGNLMEASKETSDFYKK